MTGPGIIIVGAGQAGVQAAFSLREEGYDGRIQVFGDEPILPYQRPPLSKAYLTEGRSERLTLRSSEMLDQLHIEISTGNPVERIDRAASCVFTTDGRSHGYDQLILATGTRARALALPGGTLTNVLTLRNISDADRLREALGCSSRVVIIGGGFIGLEVAAVARSMGCDVTVVEAGNRIMERAVSAPTSAHMLRLHRLEGVQIRYRVGVCRILGDDGGRATGVLLADDQIVSADLVLVAVGAVANDDLARGAGLDVANGIRVDGMLRTSDPTIFAIGDCAEFPAETGRIRLESVQNAVDQAKCVARCITGHPETYHKVPWFWSDQGKNKLQIAGLTSGADDVVHLPAGDERKFTAICFRADTLLGVETVNAPGDHIAARTLLARSPVPTRNQLAAMDFDLRRAAQGGA